MDATQVSRYSKAEMELIRNTFGGEGKILYAIRDVLLQLSPTVPQLSKDILKLVRKMLLPDLDVEVPLMQQADIYFSLQKIKEMNPGLAVLHIQERDIMRMYLEEQLDVLEGKDTKPTVALKDLKEPREKSEETRYVTMMAFLDLVSYIDARLNELKILANSKDESEDEIKKKQGKNSSK